MAAYRKKPVVIEAEQLCWKNWNAVCELMNLSDKGINAYEVETYSDTCGESGPQYIEMVIPTLEGPHIARHGDWIIKGVNDEFYPCKPDIFEKTYERVEDMNDGKPAPEAS